MKKLFTIFKKEMGKCPEDIIGASKRASFILHHINNSTTNLQLEAFVERSVNSLLVDRYPAVVHEPWIKIINRTYNQRMKEVIHII